ncbi:hypothetical protein FD755_020141, partial [Muntiacus reevesi]
KMTPQAGCSTAETLTQEDEHQIRRMMAKRAKIIKELIQTEKDYLNDLELCVQEVVQPLRNKQMVKFSEEKTMWVFPPLQNCIYLAHCLHNFSHSLPNFAIHFQ